MKKLFLNIYSFFKVSWVNTIIWELSMNQELYQKDFVLITEA